MNTAFLPSGHLCPQLRCGGLARTTLTPRIEAKLSSLATVLHRKKWYSNIKREWPFLEQS